MGNDATMIAISRFRDALAARGIHNARLVLFGSHATGRAHEWSDIDLVVISETFAGQDIWERIQRLSPAVSDSLAPIEAVALTPDEWEHKDRLVAQFAATEGVEV